MTSILKADNIQNASGSNLINESGSVVTIGANGNNIVIPVGATITNSGTQVGFGGTNTPAFSAILASSFTLTQNTLVLIPFATEQWDTDNAYDNTASNYKFTIPVGKAGKYVFTAITSIGNQPSGTWNYPVLYKNGSDLSAPLAYTFGYTSVTQDGFARIGGVINTSESDYFQIYATTNEATNKTLSSSRCIFQMYKLIE